MREEESNHLALNKIKSVSWFLAAAYVVLGVVSFGFIRDFRAMLSNMGVAMPLLTRLVLLVGPTGWLVSAALGASAVILKDLKFRSPLLNPLFTVALVLAIGTIVCATVFATWSGGDYIR